MSTTPEQAEAQRKALGLFTAMQTGESALIAGQLEALVAEGAGAVLEVLIAAGAAHIGLVRAVANRMDVTPEFMLQQAGLYWQDPPA